jgi:hypothetical protein
MTDDREGDLTKTDDRERLDQDRDDREGDLTKTEMTGREIRPRQR